MISPHIPPVSRPWRVAQASLSTGSRSHLLHVRLNLSFPLSIAKAMAFGPALRPAAPVRCHHSGYW